MVRDGENNVFLLGATHHIMVTQHELTPTLTRKIHRFGIESFAQILFANAVQFDLVVVGKADKTDPLFGFVEEGDAHQFLSFIDIEPFQVLDLCGVDGDLFGTGATFHPFDFLLGNGHRTHFMGYPKFDIAVRGHDVP